VIPVSDGIPFLVDAHLQRLSASLAGAHISNPHSDNEWQDIVDGLISRNGKQIMGIYIQVSRGTDTTRARQIPSGLTPTVFGMSLATGADTGNMASKGCAAIVLQDDRWRHCDIKTTSMLANVLLEIEAGEQQAAEAILLRDGYLTEGTSSSILVVENGILLTRPDGPELLPGTTAHRVLDIARAAGVDWREEKVSEQRLRAADEIWVMSATRDIIPVISLDDATVGTGSPGPVWEKVSELFTTWKREQIDAGLNARPAAGIRQYE
jgi:D-alanine transaminase